MRNLWILHVQKKKKKDFANVVKDLEMREIT